MRASSTPVKPTLRVAHRASLTILLAAICGCNFGSVQVMTLGNDCAGDDDCIRLGYVTC